VPTAPTVLKNGARAKLDRISSSSGQPITYDVNTNEKEIRGQGAARKPNCKIGKQRKRVMEGQGGWDAPGQGRNNYRRRGKVRKFFKASASGLTIRVEADRCHPKLARVLFIPSHRTREAPATKSGAIAIRRFP